MTRQSWTLAKLFEEAGIPHPFQHPNREVVALTDNSNRCVPNSLFVAVRGTNADGHAFISDAIERGAVAVVVEQDIPPYDSVEIIRVEDTREALGKLAHAWYGHPSRDLLVIGVSGTNGKTTTTYLLESIFSAAGLQAGVIGTIEYRFADQRLPAPNTTPTALILAETLAKMRAAGVQAVAMEVSSHSADQKRIAGIEFDVGILTNITQDHLDYHKTMEAYAAAKRSFYFDFLLRPKAGAKKREAVAVFNHDDSYGRKFAAEFPGKKFTFGLDQGADLYPADLTVDATGIRFTLAGNAAPTLEIESPLLGYFNVQNILGAIGGAIAAGLPADAIARGVAALSGVPGRFERIAAGQPFAVVVDYAHTPDALERVLANARQMTKGRVITVFGCGGERDPIKRPLMGKVVAGASDYIVVTNDNPRREDPQQIAAMILSGIQEVNFPEEALRVILDRREAIAHALAEAREGDCVLIAGKGAEPYMDINGVKIPYDDRETARELLVQLGYK